jgi:hypothetical protein
MGRMEIRGMRRLGGRCFGCELCGAGSGYGGVAVSVSFPFQ